MSEDDTTTSSASLLPSLFQPLDPIDVSTESAHTVESTGDLKEAVEVANRFCQRDHSRPGICPASHLSFLCTCGAVRRRFCPARRRVAERQRLSRQLAAIIDGPSANNAQLDGVITVGVVGPHRVRHSSNDSNTFEQMVTKAIYCIRETFNLEMQRVCLISGGSSWADHIAIELFNAGLVHSLVLHLPCEFKDCIFDDPRQVMVASTMNTIHTEFSQRLVRFSLREIKTAVAKGAVIKVHAGFLHRNRAIAHESQYLIAFTSTQGGEPGTRGTRSTWNAFSCNKERELIRI